MTIEELKPEDIARVEPSEMAMLEECAETINDEYEILPGYFVRFVTTENHYEFHTIIRCASGTEYIIIHKMAKQSRLRILINWLDEEWFWIRCNFRDWIESKKEKFV